MSRQILIIDDEERIREVVQVCLIKLANWSAIAASSGQEGLLKAVQAKPDAILLDMSMPDMDGIATFHQLQAHPDSRAIPVILLTAKVQPFEQSQYAELGVAGVIAKPFDPVQLVAQITAILGWN
jgi:CheY-like chemotaxis protein